MNELVPSPVTNTIEELTEARGIRYFTQVESTALGEARLDLERWITFTHPETLTQSEAKRTFYELLAKSDRAHCLLIIDSLPDHVIPNILPQLQDMAEYEVRMWQIRQEVEGPDIRERWISLPVTT